MAFVATSLALFKECGNGPTLWSYNTDDSPGVVKGANYFLGAYRLLTVGDFIFCETGVVGSTTTLFIVVVTAVSSASVTTTSKTVDV